MILIRADANREIATGHIMRCISIAQRFKANGHNVLFIVADRNPIPLLKRVGLDFYVLDTVWDNLDYEIGIMKEFLERHEKPLLLIDTYKVTRHYVESLIPYCKCCYLGSKKEYLGELFALINYSVSVDYDFYSSNYNEKTKLLLGPKYIPLRDEFLEKHKEKQHNKRCKLLLTTGGSNPNHYLEKILKKIICSTIFLNIDIEVIIGGMFEDVDVIREQFGSYENIQINENVKSMAVIMSQCDLAVTANGSTVYELAASYVPAITFCMAKDQINAAEKLSSMGMTEYCGVIYSDENACINKIVDKLTQYVNFAEKREDLSKKAANIIDGRGCERLYQALNS